jgi:hypothetical protein
MHHEALDRSVENKKAEEPTSSDQNAALLLGSRSSDEESTCPINIQGKHVKSSSPESPSENIEVDITASISAWDQVVDIAKEIGHSAMAKQAQIVCEVAKRDFTLRAKRQLHLGSDTVIQSNGKKRKGEKTLDHDAVKTETLKQHGIIDCSSTGSVIVSSDDDDQHNQCHDDCDASSFEGTSTSSLSSTDDDTLSRNVERMGRMSKYILEIERFHYLFRAEMEGMAAEEREFFL